jgi:hypothetical protein
VPASFTGRRLGAGRGGVVPRQHQGQHQDGEDARAPVLGHQEALLLAAGRILGQVGDVEWLERRLASELALLFGDDFGRAARILVGLPSEPADPR